MKEKLTLFASFWLLLILALSCKKLDNGVDHGGLFEHDQYITLEEAIDKMGGRVSNAKSVVRNMSIGSLPLATMAGINECAAYPEISNSLSHNNFWVFSKEVTPRNGKGIAFRYRFQRGKSYSIRLTITNVAYGTQSGTHTTQNNNPTLQAVLANESNFPASCAGSIDLTSSGLPFNNLGKIPAQKYPHNSSDFTVENVVKTFSFVASDCFEYLWFNFVPPGGDYNNRFTFNLTIQGVGESIVDGPAVFSGTSPNTYKIKFQTFYIDYPFEWSTTGNLQIVGNTVGSSVSVRSTTSGTSYGKIIASLPGCGVFAEISFDNCGTQPNKKVVNGVCETGRRRCSRSEWVGTGPGGDIYTTYFAYFFSDGSSKPIIDTETGYRKCAP